MEFDHGNITVNFILSEYSKLNAYTNKRNYVGNVIINYTNQRYMQNPESVRERKINRLLKLTNKIILRHCEQRQEKLPDSGSCCNI